MAKGRRKRRVAEPVATLVAPPPPVEVSRSTVRHPRRRARWIGAGALILVAGAGIAIAAWPRLPPFEPALPVGIERATAEVRAHIEARIQRLREKPDDLERLTEYGLALTAVARAELSSVMAFSSIGAARSALGCAAN